MEVIIATKNAGKVREMETLLGEQGITVKSLLDLDNQIEIDETGISFAENAIIKAEEISKRFNAIVIADDSGLAVDALNGRPGVYSARYAGENASDQENIDKLLIELKGVPKNERTARFHCALAVAIPTKDTVVFQGECEGVITVEEQGNNGFGYDPVFYVPQFKRTMAELTKAEKNKISHRGQAVKQLQANWQLITRGENL
jgi:XTP/dITP diphosphohydrolase